MDNRKWQANAKASPPTAPVSPSVGFPGNGGVSDPPTTPGDWLWYALTEEIRNVIVGAGLTPDNTVNQLLTAIKKGFGQVWTDFTGSRAAGTTYTNSTGFPLFVSVNATSSLAPAGLIATINATITVVSGPTPGTGSSTGIFFVVPPGQTYSVAFNTGTATISFWRELR
jgi:hypothetical protein